MVALLVALLVVARVRTCKIKSENVPVEYRALYFYSTALIRRVVKPRG